MPIFNQAHRKIIKVTFSFTQLASACKISAEFVHLLFRYSRFYSPMTWNARPIFDPQIIKVTFSFPEFVSVCIKNQFISLIPPRDTELLISVTRVVISIPFSIWHNQILFNQLWESTMNCYAKIRLFHHFYSWGIADLKILESNRQKTQNTQWLTSGEWGCPHDNGPKLAVGQANSI